MLNSKKKIIIACMSVGIFMTSSINTFALVDGNTLTTKQIAMYSEGKNASVTPEEQNKIDDKYKWNLSDIYENVQAWEKDIEKAQKDYFPKLKEYEGKLKDPKKLSEYLKLDQEVSVILNKVYWYANFKADLNQEDTEATELLSKANSLYADYSSIVTFFNPELLSQDETSLKKLMSDPLLKDYSHSIDSLIKQKAHTLSKAEQDILANSSEFTGSPKEVFDKLRLADMRKAVIKDKDGKEIVLTGAAATAIREGKDRELRKAASEATGAITKEYQNTFAAMYLFSVNKDIFLAKSQKYNSSLEASLSQDSIPKEVYENLIKAVNNNLKPLHKFIELRRKVLNIDKVHGYDLSAPIVDSYEFKVPYEEAKTKILDGLKPLGDEYLSVMKKGFDNRWLDVYESKAKTTGGYNLGLPTVHPFILLNYHDNLDSMLTVAHEMGHAVNAVYTEKAQPGIYQNTPIFNAEVASTTNELLMLKHMLKNAKSEDEKLYLLNQLIENINGAVYTQVLFSEFEKTVHERVEAGVPMSAKSLRKLYIDLITKYNGPSYEPDEFGTLGWAKISHFYDSFYVYKYATSMAASNQIVKNILDGSQIAIDDYLTFLKTGSSEYPIDALKKAGVDATQTTSIDTLLKEFGQYVDEMESILKSQGKIK